MRGLILLAVVSLAYAKSIEQSAPLSAVGFVRNVAIPLAEEIRQAEEALLRQSESSRIAGGSSSSLGQFPYQAGILTSYEDINGVGVCGGSLVSADKIVYAAHCWYDGADQGISAEVVLGSTTLFTGGNRQISSTVFMHPLWNPRIIRDDVAVVYLSSPVQFSNIIAPIALPSGEQLEEDFAGEVAIASGFGRTGDFGTGGITLAQTLSHVSLNVITNAVCRNSFPSNVVDSNICTSGAGGKSTCSGDSGGPLVVERNGEPLLIGITSFGSFWGCTLGFPAAFARVSSFMDFFNEHL